MEIIGGDIVEIVFKHPELGEFRFEAKSNETFNVDFGGVRSNDDSNMISGSGRMVDQMNRVRWSVEGPVLVVLLDEKQIAALPNLSESPKLGTFIMTHISGATYKGQGKPVGDLIVDTNTAQMPLKVAGGGKLESI